VHLSCAGHLFIGGRKLPGISAVFFDFRIHLLDPRSITNYSERMEVLQFEGRQALIRALACAAGQWMRQRAAA
jgi:hypothetical protein